MSLLLTIDKQPLSKICIPSSLADSFLSCKNSTLHNNSFLDESGNEVPLVPAEGIQQLQMLILIFAIFHVLSCVLTFGLGEAKVKFYIYKFCKIIKNSDPEELKQLGSGTFGIVYHGKWSGSDVAIKRINDRCFAGKPSELERTDEKKEVNTELKREAEFFGDIVIVPYMDSNDLLVFKTAAICEFGVRTISAKHMMKCDDDTFVRVDTLLDDLNDYPSNQSVYVGNMNVRHRTMRSRKWAVTH